MASQGIFFGAVGEVLVRPEGLETGLCQKTGFGHPNLSLRSGPHAIHFANDGDGWNWLGRSGKTGWQQDRRLDRVVAGSDGGMAIPSVPKIISWGI